jgi:hypothetical protein
VDTWRRPFATATGLFASNAIGKNRSLTARRSVLVVTGGPLGPPDVLFGAIVEHYVLGVNQTLVGPVARFLDPHWVWDEPQLLPHAWGIEDHLHFGDFAVGYLADTYRRALRLGGEAMRDVPCELRGTTGEPL